MDKIDKKIIKELDEDCRRPVSQIAKKIRISQPRLLYRIKRLEDEKLISFYYTLINTSAFGYNFYRIMLRFKSTTPEKEEQIIKELIENKNTFWIVRCSGKYDLIVDIFAKNVKNFDEILQDFLSKNFDYISQKDIVTIVKSWQYSRVFYLENFDKKEFEKSYGFNPEEAKIDDLDKNILKIISKNPLKNNHEIGKILKVDRNTVKNRIKKLIENKIIISFRAWFEVLNAGYHSYKLLIRLNNVKPIIEKSFLEFARVKKEIIYFNKVLGDWEYEYDIETEKEKDFQKLLLEIKNKFSDSIRDYEIITINKNYKLNYLPDLENS